MRFELEKVTVERQEALLNLAEFYIYHFSQYKDIDVNEQGRWDFRPVLEFVEAEAEGRYAYFVRVEGKLAGFVLVNKDVDEGVDVSMINEFFIMAKYRRQGLGQAVAIEVFNRFPGRWKVYELHNNEPAIAFWRRTIDVYTNNNYQETRVQSGDYDGYIQRFTTETK
ncbi:hypothetical protein CIG75_04040 [Tumebacillus algifaecis]|uniref:N-acetyltransferase domain-containing protein n=1 Tax=Tumebacillus algifaecis TaxID=1214604 RepID=A0A223CYI8_9BACL|nr:GNAT family N-acetyltransferase [Tumebacillus algifaecis]ASS74234.1 hypothetical protein CIG75_04040 [Tumebacillus algifaecis]